MVLHNSAPFPPFPDASSCYRSRCSWTAAATANQPCNQSLLPQHPAETMTNTTTQSTLLRGKHTLFYFHPSSLLGDQCGGLIRPTSGSHQIPVERLAFSVCSQQHIFQPKFIHVQFGHFSLPALLSRIDGAHMMARFSEGFFRSNENAVLHIS